MTGSPPGLVSRRTVLRGLAAAGGLAAMPGLAGCGSDAGGSPRVVSLGSNYSDLVPKKALAQVVKAFEQQSRFNMDVNTIQHEQYQENITAYLQGGADDVWAWFAGYRMRFFADLGLAGDLSGLWEKIGSQYTPAFKAASTGEDGNQYLVPFYYYPWGVFYRRSLFEEKGYTVPTNLSEFEALCQEMQSDGLVPLCFADKEGWPAMGTFDALNLRSNGHDFHMRLMAGEESWASDEVKSVFDTWRRLMPYHQSGSLGLDWLDSAAKLVNKEAGMYYLGMFVGQVFTDPDDRADLDFFTFPEINPEFGTDTIEAPIDGWMMAAEPENEEGALAFLEFLGTAPGQQTYLASTSDYVAASNEVDTSDYTYLQKKAVEVVDQAAHVTQFMDRDTRPDFASTVMIPSLQQFIRNPDDIDGLCSSIEEQKKRLFEA
ncbi:MAG: ABC transporter substrate-binding protein [Actinomycetota bacterium]|nr:ABC transporter substrate-binding protein [Actinomycetota bacterium]